MRSQRSRSLDVCTIRPTAGRLSVAVGVLSLGLLLLAGCQLGGGQAASALPTPPPAPSFAPFNAATPASPVQGNSAIQPHLSAIPAFTTQDMAQYVTSHPLPGSTGAASITRNVFLPSQDVVQRIGVPIGRAAATLVGYVELQGSFAFPNLQGGAPFTYAAAYEVFDAQTGNLLMYGGLRPTPTPTPTAPATATPAAPPQLSVSPPGITDVNCGTLPIPYPTATVKNSGGRILTWQVTATNTHVTVSPASGSLTAGQSQTLAVSQTSGSGGTDLNFTSNGGSAKISFACSVG
jgi:hypothetical protein